MTHRTKTSVAELSRGVLNLGSIQYQQSETRASNMITHTPSHTAPAISSTAGPKSIPVHSTVLGSTAPHTRFSATILAYHLETLLSPSPESPSRSPSPLLLPCSILNTGQKRPKNRSTMFLFVRFPKSHAMWLCKT